MIGGRTIGLAGFMGSSINFSPKHISNLALWLDASDLSSITEVSGAVSQWNDKSGQGNHALQATGAIQPTTGAHTMGGKNVLNGSSLDYIGVSSFPITANFTFFSVVNVLSTLGTTAAIVSMDATNDFQIDAGVSGEFHARINGNLGVTASTVTDYLNTPMVMSHKFSSTNSEHTLRINGTEEFVSAYTKNIDTSVFLKLGVNRPATLGPTFNFAEFIVYNSALSASEISSVEYYLTKKWGVDN